MQLTSLSRRPRATRKWAYLGCLTATVRASACLALPSLLVLLPLESFAVSVLPPKVDLAPRQPQSAAGGAEVAKFCQRHFAQELKSCGQYQNDQVGEGLIQVNCDERIGSCQFGCCSLFNCRERIDSFETP